MQQSGKTKHSVISEVPRNVTRVIQRAHNIIQHSSSSHFEKRTLVDNNPCTKRNMYRYERNEEPGSLEISGKISGQIVV